MIFNCKKLAEEELKRLKNSLNQNLSLGVVQVGDDEVSEVFINEKRKAAEKIGVEFNHYKFPKNILFNSLKKEIQKLSDDGLIVQLPIKGDLKAQKVLNLVPFEKDIDVLAESSLGKFFTGRLNILPPTVGAIDKVLKVNNIDLTGQLVAVIGPGRLVGKPAVNYFLLNKASVITIDENTKNPEELTKKADIIITGVGKPEFIDSSFIKKGAVVIDAGTSKKNGKLVGDVNTEEIKEIVKLVTPVPGGVGPLTVVSLLDNLIKRNAS
ncbi:MAG: tetrahydrofolate dehydrogenase/cyclohydrolase catalytic domain-containing protein [Patescibacteria group bacterium]